MPARRTITELREDLDWCRINADLFYDDLDRWMEVEKWRREVVACMYQFGYVRTKSEVYGTQEQRS